MMRKNSNPSGMDNNITLHRGLSPTRWNPLASNYRYVNARLYTVGRNIDAEERLSQCSADSKISIIGHRSHAKAFKFKKKGES